MKREETKTITKTFEISMSGNGYDRMSALACGIKRGFDIIGSVLGLILASPAFLLIYFLIKREDGGPVIFRQERIGYGGKPFILYKFRSMTTASEKDGKPALCQKNDKRLTKVGRFLREHHLDELPQLWNVLKGEMSFVGPRPERKFFVDQIRTMNCFTGYVPACSRLPPCITAIRTQWRKCWSGYGWIWNTCANARCGWTSRLSF